MTRRALPPLAACLLLMGCYGSVPAATSSEDATTPPVTEDVSTPTDVATVPDASCATPPEVTAEPGQIADRALWRSGR